VVCDLSSTNPGPGSFSLDLVEGRLSWQLDIPNHGALSEAEQIDAVLQKVRDFDPVYADYLSKYRDKVEARFRTIPAHVAKVDPMDDVPIPYGCKAWQIAVFYDDERGIQVDQAFWKKMKSLDRAALKIHEAVYALERDYLQAQDANHAMKVVARLFSTQPLSADLFASFDDELKAKAKWAQREQEMEEARRKREALLEECEKKVPRFREREAARKSQICRDLKFTMSDIWSDDATVRLEETWQGWWLRLTSERPEGVIRKVCGPADKLFSFTVFAEKPGSLTISDANTGAELKNWTFRDLAKAKRLEVMLDPSVDESLDPDDMKACLAEFPSLLRF
jgi:hypothetical protein